MVPMGTRWPGRIGGGADALDAVANCRARVHQYFTILKDTPFCRANSDALSGLDSHDYCATEFPLR